MIKSSFSFDWWWWCESERLCNRYCKIEIISSSVSTANSINNEGDINKVVRLTLEFFFHFEKPKLSLEWFYQNSAELLEMAFTLRRVFRKKQEEWFCASLYKNDQGIKVWDNKGDRRNVALLHAIEKCYFMRFVFTYMHHLCDWNTLRCKPVFTICLHTFFQ